MSKQVIVLPGQGKTYDWSQDRIAVKSTLDLSDGRVTLAEDQLKPGFLLARHHHKKMIEIFYVLEGQVSFAFDDERVVCTPGTTISVPAGVPHEVASGEGARMLTIFSPGGFDTYLEELSVLTESQYADAAFMRALDERFDIFH
jgi:quercetin dioxygenase-like cupin family protein